MTVKWRHCAIAERDHRKDVRNYAHTYHYPQTICLAKDFWKLPRQYRDGIILHEIGHLIAGPEGSESDANDAIYDWAGAQIDYVDSPFGKRLERLSNMAGARIARRRRNPIANEDHLPYDQWIPSHAVKFNSDGTVDLMTEGEHNARRRNQFHYSMYLSDGGRITSDVVVKEYERLGLPVPIHLQRVLAHGTSYSNEDFDAMAGAVDELSREHGIARSTLAALANKSVARAYFDEYGDFHPIRTSPDYSYKAAHEKKPKHPRKSKAQKFY